MSIEYIYPENHIDLRGAISPKRSIYMFKIESGKAVDPWPKRTETQIRTVDTKLFKSTASTYRSVINSFAGDTKCLYER